jgi:hypothetical protein
MPLIVEDNTGLANAESYISVADADVYLANMGRTSWAAATTAAKEIALRKATQYIDTAYSFRGARVRGDLQALEFPRDSGYEEWPVKRLRDACCELAVIALGEELVVANEDRPVTQETVGPLSVTYGASRFSGQKRFVHVDRLLRPLTRGGVGGSLRLERA